MKLGIAHLVCMKALSLHRLSLILPHNNEVVWVYIKDIDDHVFLLSFDLYFYACRTLGEHMWPLERLSIQPLAQQLCTYCM